MKRLLNLSFKSVTVQQKEDKPAECELLTIAQWDGNYINIVAILVEYNPEFRVRISGTRLIVKEYTDESKTKFKYYKCFAIGSEVIIPKYERRPYCAICEASQGESELRLGSELLPEDPGDMHSQGLRECN